MTMNETERAAVRDAIDYLETYGEANRSGAPYSWAPAQALVELRKIVTGSPSKSTATVPEGDSLSRLLADLERSAETFGPASFSAEMAARLRAVMKNDSVEPKGVDVVRGGEVNDLPNGSLVVVSDPTGKPAASAAVRQVGGANDSGNFAASYYRVLERAPEKPINVGDVIAGKRADTLPQDSVVQRNTGMYPLIKAVTGWRMGPGDNPFGSLAREYGSETTFRVLLIGGK